MVKAQSPRFKDSKIFKLDKNSKLEKESEEKKVSRVNRELLDQILELQSVKLKTRLNSYMNNLRK